MNKLLFLMVRSLNKWFLCSSVGFVFIAKTIQSESIDNFSRPSGNNLHPFHVSTTEINFNAADKTLEISCRLFIDDFESCLSSVYHTKADLSAAHAKTSMDSLVKRYIVAHLQIKTDGKQSGTHYLGFEKEDEAVNVFFEVENMIAVKKIEVNNSILYDLYDDQMNIIHVVVGGNRKSTKLDYPKREAAFNF